MHIQTNQSENKEKQWSDQLTLGQYKIKNRICLAALTRQRCHPSDGIPTELVVTYYTQRVGAGIMLSEASAWHQRGQAFPGAANLSNKNHAQGWKKVIQSIHKKNGIIFLQLFHAGRATHKKINGNLQVWAPSPIACRQTMRILEGEPYPIPKQMDLAEIKEVQEQFRNSIILAREVGFDGVQIHGAHGYLVDQFLRSSTNKRSDKYGGSVENRCRFCLELFQIALEYFKPWQLGIKISPVSRFRDMFDQNPLQTYSYLLKQLSLKNIGFVEIRESTQVNLIKSQYNITPAQQIQKVCKTLKPYFKGIMIGNDSFTQQSGLKYIQEGSADMISFGRLYVSNPDLSQRIVNGWEVNQNWNPKTFYGFEHGQNGYIDYPFYGKENL